MIGDSRMFTLPNNEVDDQEKITFENNSKSKVRGFNEVAISIDHSIISVLLVASLALIVGQFCDLSFQCLFTKEVVVSRKDDNQVTFK